jgi:heat-inducible transcriptional repressor
MTLPLDPSSLKSLDQRSREIFRLLVESYLNEGSPVGSRNLSRLLPQSLSPATVRNVLSDLEQLGLVYSPHVSAGRMPTQLGLRFFVDAFMEIGDLTSDERRLIETQVRSSGEGRDMDRLLNDASQMLSGLSQGAGLVLAGKTESALKHIEFVQLEPTKALAILVAQNGDVENRVIDLPPGVTASQLIEASNYLSAHVRGRTLATVRADIANLKGRIARELDTLGQELVNRGLAIWTQDSGDAGARLIVRGRSNLLSSVSEMADIERIRMLFDDLEAKDGIVQLLDLAEQGPGVRIFIGSENRLFSLSGSSLVVAPYRDQNQKVVGALGVIGPTRLNYARIVPMVDYTAQLISRIIG